MFAISVTPRKYLHDLFSHHIDYTYSQYAHTQEKVVVTYKFNCGFNETIALDPFLGGQAFRPTLLMEYIVSGSSFIPEYLYSTSFHYFVHRGPPTA
ncbi:MULTISPECIES: hypothetical protein [Chitinophagaceae]|uniref:Uncharacterized protein n=1 Tax=Niabella digestorum TaxID=3117701 RepID=A0ABU7RFD6_9BACT